MHSDSETRNSRTSRAATEPRHTPATASVPPRTPAPGRGTQAIDRAVGLLTTVITAGAPPSFADLQLSGGLPKSTTSRLLSALERADLVMRHPAGRYSPGPLFWRYATERDTAGEFVRLARSTLERIGADTSESVHLAVVHAGQVAQVAQVDAHSATGTTRDWARVAVPDHCSALGKVLQAYGRLPIPDEPLDRPTGRSLGRIALIHQLRECARRGWASTTDELEVGLAAVAVPVRAGEGEVIGAIGISGPTERLAGRTEEIAQLLVHRVDGLSRRLDGHAESDVLA